MTECGVRDEAVDKPDDIGCAAFLRQLDDYVDRELRPAEMHRLEAHLEGCLGCAAAAQFERAVLDGLRCKLRRIEMPAELAARVHARLSQA